jgi:hypothetical protein
MRTTRTWWLLERDAHPIAIFRAGAGVLLAVYFLQRCGWLANALRPCGVSYDRQWLRIVAAHPAAWLSSDLSLSSTRLLSALGVFLSILLALGIYARVLAGLLAIGCAHIHSSVWPALNFDDWVTGTVVAMLVLMPISHPLAPRASSKPLRRVSGLAVTAHLVLVVYFYVSTALALRPEATTVSHYLAMNALRAIPIAYLVPLNSFRVIGAGMQCCLHLYIARSSGAYVGNGILALTSLLFWGEASRARGSLPAVNASGAVAVLCMLVCCVQRVLGAGVLPGTLLLERLATNFGLTPLAATWFSSGQPLETVRLSVVDGATGSTMEYRDDRCTNDVAVSLKESLGEHWRLVFSESVARAHCARAGYLGQHGRVTMTTEGDPGRVMEFECGPMGSLGTVR